MNKRLPAPKLPLDLSSSEDLKHFEQDGPSCGIERAADLQAAGDLAWIGVAAAAWYDYVGK